MTLPAHQWDDAFHRRIIHAAFDAWFVAFMNRGAVQQAGRLKYRLEQLILDAEYRRVFDHPQDASPEAPCSSSFDLSAIP